MKRARRPTKDTPTPRARRARAASSPTGWEVADHDWGRLYARGFVEVEALMEGAEVVLVRVRWRHLLGVVDLADGVRASIETARLMRWLARGNPSRAGVGTR